MSPAAVSGTKKLGQILVERGWITPEELVRALRTQRSLGGRLGTCLLDMAAISEDQLQRALGEQHGLPVVSPEELKNIPEEIYRSLPERVARRCRAVAFRLLGGRLDVAMLNPGDLAGQDEVGFASGKRINVYAVTEVRLGEALERYYGEECSDRFTALLDQLNRTRYLWSQEKPASRPASAPGRGESTALFTPPPPLPEISGPRAAASPATEPAAAPGEGPERRRERRSVALTREERRALYSGRPPAGPAPVPTGDPRDEPFAVAEAQIDSAGDREEIGAALLDVLSARFSRGALFAVRKNRVEGWKARGAGVSREVFAKFEARLDEPSVFLNLRAGSSFHLGPLAPLPIHEAIAHSLGGDLPDTAFLMPVRIGDRLVAVLYGDGGREQAAGLDVGRFQSLADRAATAFGRCIVLKKKRQGRGQVS